MSALWNISIALECSGLTQQRLVSIPCHRARRTLKRARRFPSVFFVSTWRLHRIKFLGFPSPVEWNIRRHCTSKRFAVLNNMSRMRRLSFIEQYECTELAYGLSLAFSCTTAHRIICIVAAQWISSQEQLSCIILNPWVQHVTWRMVCWCASALLSWTLCA